MRINPPPPEIGHAYEAEPTTHLAHGWPAQPPLAWDVLTPRQVTATIDLGAAVPLGHGCYRVRRAPSQ